MRARGLLRAEESVIFFLFFFYTRLPVLIKGFLGSYLKDMRGCLSERIPRRYGCA